MATTPDKINTGALATVLVVGAISMVGISAALTAMVRSEVENHANEKGAHANLRLKRDLDAKARSELIAEPAWSDRATGKVSVPIERAMDLVVEDLKKHPEHATAPTPHDGGRAQADAGAAPLTEEGGATSPEAGTQETAEGGTGIEPKPAPELPAPEPAPDPELP